VISRVSSVGALPFPPQQHFDDRKRQRRIDLQDRAAVVRLQAQRDQAGGRRKRLRELQKRKLFDGDQIDHDVRAKVSRKARRHTAREIFVQEMDRAQLVFRNAIGAAKIVRLGLRCVVLRRLRVRHLERIVDFLLRQKSVHSLLSTAPARFCCQTIP